MGFSSCLGLGLARVIGEIHRVKAKTNAWREGLIEAPVLVLMWVPHPSENCMSPPSVLLVCLGNICRSPLAEAALRAECERLGLNVVIESAGTGSWHIGKPPDRRAQAVARRNGLDISGYQARQVCSDDFYRYDHIVALDADNLTDLSALDPTDGTARLSLLMDHVPGRRGEPVADPYYGDDSGFDVTWADVTAGARSLAQLLAAS